ncbi:SDR family NAD(P)-dependent oxidoreductase [Paraburkholderia sp. BL25I1N1]|uniref:SDR family NAD(P)-dependent oxidoreductase n=1 Tax=Paraburkholderia sp. BL25I1N1 TaxID=1938804 RepID=UPI000D0764EC|nr:SDR family NAD(P)-dependent oxidoreductase [Paraburkholderia sp. BL25I1N1]PRY04476.1 NADP-dependent 3-hydroxy acid dehydrogenase YdfG [Paraburkholderia sp. BL25I1N1]
MRMPAALVVGVGAARGLGAALCRKFSEEGHHVFVAGRTAEKIEHVVAAIKSSGGSAEAVLTDATNEDDVAKLFKHAFAENLNYDKPDLIVFNAGNNKRMEFLDVSAKIFEEFWRVGCFAGFLVGKEAAHYLGPLGRGTVIFTGASASLRGKAGFAQFAAAKAGLRMVSQSMAREFGPRGIHVAHVVIDGGIDGERLQRGNPERFASAGRDGLLNTDSIAQTYWHIYQQAPSAWTQEVDLRPFKESY